VQGIGQSMRKRGALVKKNKAVLGLHPQVWLLGLVSFLTDVSSEMIFSVFSIVFTTIAGASSALLGIVEGTADFAASSLDYVAGWYSDKTGKRKRYALIGYGFSTIAKAVLLVSTSIAGLGIFRMVERLGKSFRGPPRDAWLSDIAVAKTRGYSFGAHKAMDKAGAIIGPLIAYWLLSTYGESLPTFKLLFVVAIVPAVLAVIVLAVLKDKPGKRHERENIFKAHKTLSGGFQRYLVSAGIFSLAYFSFGFLLLRAYGVGFDIKDVVLLYVLFNIAFVLVAAPIGRLGDRIGRRWIVLLGYLSYAAMCVGFVYATSKAAIVLLFVLFGVFYAIDEAQSKAFIADVEKKRRATAIGFYNFITGVIYLPASLIAGALWTVHPTAAFSAAALLSIFAAGVFLTLKPWEK
jgi:MFS family permease